MTAAMEAVQDGTAKSINQAARQHGVPASTLKDRLSGRVIHGTKPGLVPYLSSKEEDELAVYLVEASKLGYGKTRRQVKGIVEKVAIDNYLYPHVDTSNYQADLNKENHVNLANISEATFTPEKEALFMERLEEGYDVYDAEYLQWLEVSHPEAVSSYNSRLALLYSRCWIHLMMCHHLLR